jgi:hypothetical protein
MRKFFLICLTALIVVVNTAGQEQTSYRSAEALQREVTFLLLDQNINEVTNRLESESASTASLIRRLVIYQRAGQTSRISSTIRQLSSLENWRCEVGHDLRWLIRSADPSFEGQRFFYERLCPDATEAASDFVTLWISNGDPKELDAWLAERSNRHDEWRCDSCSDVFVFQ